jgi:two-component system, NarL family, nitrate/nitrite response regulator NarL
MESSPPADNRFAAEREGSGMQAPDGCATSLAEPEKPFELELVQVFIVADVSVHRAGLQELLEREARIHVIGASATVPESIAEISDLAPDVVLLDIAGEDRVPASTALVHTIPGVKVVACAVPETEQDVIPCAEAGVAACLPRETPLADLGATIEHVASGESSVSPRVAAMLLRRIATLAARDSPEARLTAREEEIIVLIDDGLSNKEIALRLSIELPTVKNHVHNILEKLHVRRRYEAAARMRARTSPVSALRD